MLLIRCVNKSYNNAVYIYLKKYIFNKYSKDADWLSISLDQLCEKTDQRPGKTDKVTVYQWNLKLLLAREMTDLQLTNEISSYC